MMFPDLNAQLVDVKEKIHLRDRLQGQLADVERSLAQEDSRLEVLEAQLKREEKDVKSLEGLSLAGMFYSVLGDKEQRQDKERQEFLAARLQRDQCQYAVSTLERDLDDLKQKLAALTGLDAAYQSLLDHKERLLLQSDNPNLRQLLALSEDQARLQASRKEIQEAIEAGQALISILDEVIQSLNSAEGWGTWDMLGGGFLADLAKHSRIDDAREKVHQAQELLRRFQRELADVQSGENFLIDISSFDTFADFFIDGLIVDWIVQSKIQTSLDRTSQVRQRVAAILQRLQNQAQDIQHQLEGLAARRKELIEKS